MPLFLHESLRSAGEWGIWKIEEHEEQLLHLISLFPEELQQLKLIRGRGRRCEFLAARHLLHLMSGRTVRAELVKDTNGKPHLSDSLHHVSISHTHGFSAAVAHPNPCGIDVQRLVPKIRRIARKFVNVEESRHLDPDQELVQLHLIWSAKEAMYKAYGRRELDFRENLRVNLSNFDPANPTLSAHLNRNGITMNFTLDYRCYTDFVLVSAIEQPATYPPVK